MFVKSSTKVLYLFLSIITLLSLCAGAQLPQPPDRPLVRLIYFVPSDKDIDTGSVPILGQGWDERIRNLAVKTQSLYEQEMRRHGFKDANGNGKTFSLERNKEGEIVVHKIHGKFSAPSYQGNDYTIDEELFFGIFPSANPPFNPPFSAAKEDIYLIFIETDEYLTSDGHACGRGHALNHDSGPPPYILKPPLGLFGIAKVVFNDKCVRANTLNFDKYDTAIQHELGHAFGLQHDYRNDEYVMSYGSVLVGTAEDFGTTLSKRAAEWLNHHRAFNEVQGPLNSNTTFMKDAKKPGQVVVTDPNGLGSVQVIKHNPPEKVGDVSLVDGKSSNIPGNTEIVFDPTSFSATIKGKNINIAMNDEIMLQAIDKHGNIIRLKNVALNNLPDANPRNPRALLIPRVLFPPGVLTEATLAGGTVSLELTGATYTTDLSRIRQAVTVNGIKGVTIDTANVQRSSDKKITVTLDFDGTDFDTNATLTFRVTADAIANHTGDELTAEISVTAHKETLSATTVSPLTETTLDESMVTLTLTGAAYDPDISKIRNAVMVSGIKGVSVNTTKIQRLSDRRVTVTLNFDGTDFYRDTPLTFSVDAGAITNYKGDVLTAKVPVTASRDESLLKIFWVDTYTNKIQRANHDGSNIEDLVTHTQGLRYPNGIALDIAGGTMYWTDTHTHKIQRANLDGSNTENLVTRTQGLRTPNGIALDVEGGKMYWTDSGTDKIQRANLDGSNIEDLVTHTQGLRRPNGIALDIVSGKMYWIDRDTDKIQRANHDGSNIENLVTRTQGLRSPYDIVLDIAGGKMYWTDSGTNKIQRANLDGSNIENLVTRTQGLRTPNGIALDVEGGKMYWTDWDTDKIQRANLNGSNIEDLVTQELHSPRDIAISILSPVNPAIVKEDVNRDGVVDVHDLVYVAQQYGKTGTNSANVNDDEVVDVDDFIMVAAAVDTAAAAPAARAQVQSHFTAAQLQQWLTEARASGNTSHTYQRGIAVLKQLLALVTPQETALLANYPNPFNPETWIPYQLSKPADVTLTIYDIQGRVVRALDLEHQRAGTYHSRSRAAYWDGRNAVGESVASGVYFYTLTAGDFSATRKLLIRK